MSLVTTLLLNQPITFPVGVVNKHWMDNKAPTFVPPALARRPSRTIEHIKTMVFSAIKKNSTASLNILSGLTNINRRSLAIALDALVSDGKIYKSHKLGKETFYKARAFAERNEA